jgi:small subunit ribosomal protein S14
MAKKSVIARQLKREKIAKKHEKTFRELQKASKDKSISLTSRLEVMKKLSSLPRDAHPIRQRNRCQLTGRPRGVFSRFGICRHKIRELMSRGEIPGVEKASW